jgi:hypothetical protein
MCEDCYRELADATAEATTNPGRGVTYEEGLAVLLEVSLIGVHHAVQPWQEFPTMINCRSIYIRAL